MIWDLRFTIDAVLASSGNSSQFVMSSGCSVENIHLLAKLALLPPHPHPMASQACHKSVSPYETNASRYVVPRWGRGRKNMRSRRKSSIVNSQNIP